MPPPLKMPAPKAVLFDWDGTLANTIPFMQKGVNQVLSQFNHPPIEFGKASLVSVTGTEQVFKALLGEHEGMRAKIIYESYMDDLYFKSEEFINFDLSCAGATSLLEYLIAQEVPVAVVTNKRANRFSFECDRLGYGRFFSTAITLDQVENRKPHPEMVELALSRLGLTAGPDVWMVGDHKVDSESAKQAGIVAVHLDDGFEISATHPPDIVVANLSALHELIRSLHAGR